MARHAGLKDYTCKIVAVKPVEGATGEVIVLVEIDDGDKELGPYRKRVRLASKSHVNIEDFWDHLSGEDMLRPDDPYTELREAMKENAEYVIKLTV